MSHPRDECQLRKADGLRHGGPDKDWAEGYRVKGSHVATICEACGMGSPNCSSLKLVCHDVKGGTWTQSGRPSVLERHNVHPYNLFL